MWIKAIHKIPESKIAVIVLSHLIEFSKKLQPSKKSKRDRVYFERILHYIDDTLPTVTPQWTLRIVQENDFLEELVLSSSKSLDLNMDTCLNPYSLELLSINISKTCDNTFCDKHDSCKNLGMIDQKDIIEVFV